MGREATIVYPYVDLKFRDDTKHGVLIHTYYSDTSITVALFGDTDGRTVKEEKGYDVEFDRVIDQPGRPQVRQHYRVHYPMLQNTVLVGTAPVTTTTTP